MTVIARALATAGLLFAASTPVYAQTPHPAATQFLPIKDEPAPQLFVDQPLPGPLASRAVVIIPYRTENFRILPIFGASASDVSPRAGHLHVSIDDLPWRWADAGGTGAVVLTGLPPGEHKVLIEIATPEHEVLGGKAVKFTVPAIDSAHH
ncbi:DUF6130 family protein [Rhizobium hidalgonense]|uniref:DUF6130 family protein n=1 Tax=Rhizobium hidalgonense TaxID=1538159 RepID=A0A2A6KII4_9HYPH|nr:DUF6130 family protein [Rhizobium hidalgonense]MDR9773860.1 DUF6130 family protein [Rhizobium hidalgonense]MDR9819762.1 DUF6130 family protein [Rhizobium hidalgonense]PDT24348.1 hypothetical protein CO674_06510 [Rhizobium hidalgonense]PON04736.1 hypothetical protein ATY29_25025 [Rhizobium hidalgonense]